ncbi:hypothetical protein DN069_21460 [Streptacidiphilus pinicola]|uniref:Uncharacterized protein n=1 Tax=Streptacidiphilus pinicola TaxID=2219663 RepID=A0A2X0K2R0_9ACTN|nr:hypothetical protein [Streptacidiphilus pinicola]RAG83565.1 hypothetical protein DN069_21460 [Streptacidiphilus pinicola]
MKGLIHALRSDPWAQEIADATTTNCHEAFWATLGGIAAVVGVVQVLATAMALRTYGVAMFRFYNPPVFSQFTVLAILGLTSYYAQGFILFQCLRSLAAQEEWSPRLFLAVLEVIIFVLLPVLVILNDHVAREYKRGLKKAAASASAAGAARPVPGPEDE